MVAIALPRAAPADFLELAKPRITGMVMLTVAAGYAMAPDFGEAAAPHALVLTHALVGTALVAASASTFNQIAERDVDARMARTARRPLPCGRVSVAEARFFAWSCAIAGLVYLLAFVNPATALLAAATLVSYALMYTPLKRRTPLATLVGAVPGALPILGGWAAAGATLDVRAWVLFWILFFWQLPHFLALSWMYRDDYARAGLKMLSVEDEDGRSTFRQAVLNAAALLPISLAPAVLGMAGAPYFLGAALLSAWFLWAGIAALRERSIARARKLFVVSLMYLPGILGLMIANRLT